MKTKEFIERAERLLGVDVVEYEEDTKTLLISNPEFLVALVSVGEEHVMTTSFKQFENLPKMTQAELFKLLVEYATTPIEEREEEEKFYIKFPGIENSMSYLNLSRDGAYMINDRYPTLTHKNRFSQTEIDNFSIGLKNLISVAEWIPVEEGDS